MTAIFCGSFTCKPHMYGRGIVSSTRSVMILGTAMPMKNFGISMHVPPTTVGSQAFRMGVHVKIAAASFSAC